MKFFFVRWHVRAVALKLHHPFISVGCLGSCNQGGFFFPDRGIPSWHSSPLALSGKREVRGMSYRNLLAAALPQRPEGTNLPAVRGSLTVRTTRKNIIAVIELGEGIVMQSNFPAGASYQAPAYLNSVSTHTMGVCHLCHLCALLLTPGTLQSPGAKGTVSYRVRFLLWLQKGYGIIQTPSYVLLTKQPVICFIW